MFAYQIDTFYDCPFAFSDHFKNSALLTFAFPGIHENSIAFLDI
jgi:hypothetical protein